jgi:transposase
MKNDTIGVDISKDHLDVYRMADGASQRFANDKGGYRAFVKWLAQKPVERVVFEPTGPYHRAFERALGTHNVPLVKVNPRQARRFAEATGKLAKTDRLDAAVLARMGAVLELQTRPTPSNAVLELKELYMARESLVKDRTRAKNRGKILSLPLLKRQNAQRLEQAQRQIDAVEAAILAAIEGNADLAARFAILTSIPGVSNITAFALLIEMPELGSLEAGQAASLAGRALLGSHLLRANPDAGLDTPSFAAAAPCCGRHSTCLPWLPLASTQILGQSTTNSPKPENPQKSPSPQSCES